MNTYAVLIVLGGLLALAALIGAKSTPRRMSILETRLRMRGESARAAPVWLAAEAIQPSGQRGTQRKPVSGAPGPIQFYIRDHLGLNQVKEDVRIVIDSREVGKLSVDAQHRTSILPVEVDGAGQHRYALEVTTFLRKDRGQPEKAERAGQGTFIATPGKIFRLTANPVGDSWSVGMEEEEEELEE